MQNHEIDILSDPLLSKDVASPRANHEAGSSDGSERQHRKFLDAPFWINTALLFGINRGPY